MKVSIAMACYNGAAFLKEQLDSFARQTRLPDELVACDDGSGDATVEILRAFAATAPFEVRVERNEANLGFGRNFAKAFSLCTGDVIFPSDQDDAWYPAKVATMLEWLEARPATLAVWHDAEITDEALRPVGVTKLAQIRAAGMDPARSFVHGGCAALRREFLDFALPFPQEFAAHDSWFGELAAYLGGKDLVPQPLILYRIHATNTSRNPLNRAEKVTGADLALGRLCQADAVTRRKEFDVERGKLAALESRFVSRKGGLPARFDQGALARALAAVRSKRGALDRRARLADWPRVLRPWPAMSLLLSGDYRRHFNGYRSFIKDMIG